MTPKPKARPEKAGVDRSFDPSSLNPHRQRSQEWQVVNYHNALKHAPWSRGTSPRCPRDTALAKVWSWRAVPADCQTEIMDYLRLRAFFKCSGCEPWNLSNTVHSPIAGNLHPGSHVVVRTGAGLGSPNSPTFPLLFFSVSRRPAPFAPPKITFYDVVVRTESQDDTRRIAD